MTDGTRRTFEIDTDVGALMLHHPDALGAFEGWEVGWYDEMHAHERAARDGTLVAWGTGGDATFRVRVAALPGEAEPLTAEERARLLVTSEARCDAARGTLFLDNSDGLPGEERRDDAADMQARRIDLPPGRYRARIHALDDGADEENQDGTWDGPHYVVALTPVDAAGWDAIRPPRALPDLRPWPIEVRDLGLYADGDVEAFRRAAGERLLLARRPDAMPSAEALRGLLQPGHLAAGTPTRARHPLVPAPDLAVLPGERRTITTTADWMGWTWSAGLGDSRPRFLHEHAISAPVLEDGAPAVLCRVTGAGQAGAAGIGRLSLWGLAPVRLRRPEGHAEAERHQLRGLLKRDLTHADMWGVDLPLMATADILPLREIPEAAPLPAGMAERLRARIDAILRVDAETPVLALRPSSHAQERSRVAWLGVEAEPLVDWLLRRLALPAPERLRLWDASHAERLAGMEGAIAAAEAGRAAGSA